MLPWKVAPHSTVCSRLGVPRSSDWLVVRSQGSLGLPFLGTERAVVGVDTVQAPVPGGQKLRGKSSSAMAIANHAPQTHLTPLADPAWDLVGEQPFPSLHRPWEPSLPASSHLSTSLQPQRSLDRGTRALWCGAELTPVGFSLCCPVPGRSDARGLQPVLQAAWPTHSARSVSKKHVCLCASAHRYSLCVCMCMCTHVNPYWFP